MSSEWNRLTEAVATESQEPERWLYVSFADEDGFRGAVVVRARGIVTALARCHLLGINPGGEALGVEVPPDELPAPEYRERLIKPKEMEKVFGECVCITSEEA